MSKDLHLNSKNRPLIWGACFAWVLFLSALSSRGGESISADCLSCSGHDDVEAAACDEGMPDFSDCRFDPQSVDVAESFSSGSSLGSGSVGRRGMFDVAKRQSVLDVYYSRSREANLISTGANETIRVGLWSTVTDQAGSSVQEDVRSEAPSRKTVSRKKRRIMSLIYMLACGEKY